MLIACTFFLAPLRGLYFLFFSLSCPNLPSASEVAPHC
jgi:hypothetical protein